MNDLVKRLRAEGYDTIAGFKIKQECANRIEELQRELAEANARIEYLEEEIVNLGYEMRELESRQ